MTKITKNALKTYYDACNAIVTRFRDVYHLRLNADYWVGGYVGGCLAIDDGEYYINMDDIVLMLEENVTWEQFVAWYNYNVEVGLLNLTSVNLKSWLRGAPRYKDETLSKLCKLHSEVEKLTDEALGQVNSY